MFNLKRKKEKEENPENIESPENIEKPESLENLEFSEETEEPGTPESPDSPEKPASPDLAETFAAWLDANIADEERRQSALDAMGILTGCLDSGEWSETLFDLIARGADYSRAVAEAETAGEVRGRNASIDELTELEYATDGVPHPGTGSDTGRGPSIFDIARDAN